MDHLLKAISADFPAITFAAGRRLQWSPRTATIYYHADDPAVTYGILHELGHAHLGHKDYTSDVDLLSQEVAAWRAAKELGQRYSVQIDDDYMEGCLDSYREWLHARSACPRCGSHGLERSRNHYLCVNCATAWGVGGNRFCRTYRATNVTAQ